MKYLKQVVIILAFTGLGELLAALIPFPIPAAIYGLVLMLIALCTGVLKVKHIDTTARFLLSLLPFLLVSPAVNILKYWGVIRQELLAICVIVVVTTFLVFAVSGLVTKWLLGRKEDSND